MDQPAHSAAAAAAAATSAPLSHPPPRVGWLGVGLMGLGMATRLHNHLQTLPGAPALIYHNRTVATGAPLRAIGAIPSPSVAELVRDVDILFMSLSNDAALSAVVDSFLAADDINGKIIVDTTSVLPESSARAAARLGERGAHFVASPVLGSATVAAAGQLVFVIAGPESAVQAMEPFVVGVMARATIKMGEAHRDALSLKYIYNFLGFSLIETLAKAHTLAEKTGIGSEAVQLLIGAAHFERAFEHMSQTCANGLYIPPEGFPIWARFEHAIKDMKNLDELGDTNGVRLDTIKVVREHLEIAKQWTEKTNRVVDALAIYGATRQCAGLDFESDAVKKRDGPGGGEKEGGGQ